MRLNDEISDAKFLHFLRENTLMDMFVKKPHQDGWLTDKMWVEILSLSKSIPGFQGFYRFF